MSVWFNAYFMSLTLYSMAYISNSGLIASIPTVLVLFVAGLTIFRLLLVRGMQIPNEIIRPFNWALILLLFFLVKHIFVSGGTGLVLATKIVAYHIIFIAGLLMGYNETFFSRKKFRIYIVLLILYPLMFFFLISQGRDSVDALFFFNRNPFAAYIIISSAILLDFTNDRPSISIALYVVFMVVVLAFVSTLGALLSFLLAVAFFLLPKAMSDRRILFASIFLAVIFCVLVVYIISNPGAFNQVTTVERFRFVGGLFSNILRYYDGSWIELDMATAVMFAPSNNLDMSAVFRILHWIDIFRVISTDTSKSIWIGGGTNWVEFSKDDFVYKLAAHNEYVRLIAEQGIVHFLLIFSSFIIGLFVLRRNLIFIPLLAAIVYFASENTFNDFVSASMFFLFFGFQISRALKVRSGSRLKVNSNS